MSARRNTPEPLRMPLLDRLIGAGDGGRPGPGAGPAPLRVIREYIQRDLESLLNTRWRCRSWPPTMDELDQSVVNYGIPDFTGASFDNPISQRDFRQIIARAITRFEPRLRDVRVTLLTDKSPGASEDRTLRFRIEAVLTGDRDSQRVAYETQMDPTDSTFKVKRAGQ